MSEQQRWKLNAALRLGCRIIMEQCKWKHCETSQVWDIETFHYGSGDLALTAWCGWCSSLAPPILEQHQESHRACLTHRAVLFSEGGMGQCSVLCCELTTALQLGSSSSGLGNAGTTATISGWARLSQGCCKQHGFSPENEPRKASPEVISHTI